MMRHHCLAMLLLSAVSLAACAGQDDMTRNFGVSRDAPSATSSMPLLPLSVPPTLSDRPLRPGATASPVLRDQANSGAPALGRTSAGQEALVGAASGGIAAPTDIRQQIDDDTRIVHTSPQFVDYLMSWTPAPGSQTMFQTPKKSWFGGIF